MMKQHAAVFVLLAFALWAWRALGAEREPPPPLGAVRACSPWAC
jgi:hypothetical protein